ncbi:MAG: hypothetical protein R3E32_00135 [Chitinophagales bacterium]
MKKVVIFSLLCLPIFVFAQVGEKISPENLKTLKQQEHELIEIFSKMVNAPYDSVKAQQVADAHDPIALRSLVNYNDSVRLTYCYKFIPTLVNALKTPNSYEYPFDSLKSVSILKPADNSFRIFTWTIPLLASSTYRYFGAIQMNSGELKLIPLEDKSANAGQAEDKVLDAANWFGALYYNIKQVTHNNKKYYMLFGWDGNNERSDIKVLEVLQFEEGKAVFGAPIIEVVREDEPLVVKHRFLMEFQDKAIVNLNFDVSQGKIIFDHLEPKDEKSKGYYFDYIPDGTYEGLEFVDGMWKYVPKVYHAVLQTAPVPKPLFDSNTKKSNKKKKSKKKKAKKKKRN